ncbi:MAG: LysR family transcriptional regulator [Myxococcota bacterium]
MDRFHEMQVFRAVAEERSFGRAARRLGLSAPSATRAVAALEQRLGTKLLHRTTRGVRPTEAGERFLADCRRILGDLEQSEGAVAAGRSDARGTLAITAPVVFGDLVLTPIVIDFLAREPGISIRAVFADRIVSLVEEGIEVAIRIGPLPDSGLTAKRVGSVRSVVCGSPDFLASHGRPAHPSELDRFPIITSVASTLVTEWRFEAEDRPVVVRPTPRFSVSSNRAAIEAARLGAGLTRVLSYQVDPFVTTGALEVVLADHEADPIPVHVVHAGGRSAPAKVRAFVDHCVAALRKHPALR